MFLTEKGKGDGTRGNYLVWEEEGMWGNISLKNEKEENKRACEGGGEWRNKRRKMFDHRRRGGEQKRKRRKIFGLIRYRTIRQRNVEIIWFEVE